MQDRSIKQNASAPSLHEARAPIRFCQTKLGLRAMFAGFMVGGIPLVYYLSSGPIITDGALDGHCFAAIMLPISIAILFVSGAHYFSDHKSFVVVSYGSGNHFGPENFIKPRGLNDF